MADASKKNLNDLRWQTLQLQVSEHRIREVFKMLRKRGIEPILIKGWAAARFYPNPSSRFSSDIDLAVRAGDFARAEAVLKEVTFDVDLHRELRHLDRLDWDELFENAELVSLGSAEIRVLRLEDHLRVLCVHWLNDGGANKEKLKDIYYALKNRPADFDWDRFLNAAGERRRRWFECAVGLAQKYLGLGLENTPLENAAEKLPKWVTETVEKEWRSETRLIPLQRCLDDRKLFWRQIKKRFPPNPIQATIELEGSFDQKPRIFYQLGNVLTRLTPSIRRILKKRAQKN